jgi:hypothetical protein
MCACVAREDKKINENKLVGSTTTWDTIWGPVYEHLCFMIILIIIIFSFESNQINLGLILMRTSVTRGLILIPGRLIYTIY